MSITGLNGGKSDSGGMDSIDGPSGHLGSLRRNGEQTPDRGDDLRGAACGEYAAVARGRAAPARDGARHAVRASAGARGSDPDRAAPVAGRGRPGAAGVTARDLPVRRAGPRSERIRRVAVGRARPGRARARRLRARGRARRGRRRAADPRHLPWRADAQRLPRRHAASAPAGDHRSLRRASPDRPGWEQTHPVSVDPGSRLAADPGHRRAVGELVPPPGRRPPRRRAEGGRVGAGRHDRGHRGPRRAARAGRAVARGDTRPRAPTRGCSRRSWPRPPASRLDVAA